MKGLLETLTEEELLAREASALGLDKDDTGLTDRCDRLICTGQAIRRDRVVPGRHLLGMRNGPHHLPRRLVFENSVKDDVAEQVVVSAGQVCDLDPPSPANPMHA